MTEITLGHIEKEPDWQRANEEFEALKIGEPVNEVMNRLHSIKETVYNCSFPISTKLKIVSEFKETLERAREIVAQTLPKLYGHDGTKECWKVALIEHQKTLEQMQSELE